MIEDKNQKINCKGGKMIDKVNTCVVIGLGLIGGSLAAALKEAHICQIIIGIDVDESTLAVAKQEGIIDQGSTSLFYMIHEADLVILATPVRHIIQILKEIETFVKPGCIIMDVGSTKTQVVAAMNMLPDHIQAIGGHPMSGPVTTGIGQANANMFKNKVFVLTPTQRTSASTQVFAEHLVRQIGARLVVLDADRHDHLVAIISHLPRILPIALLDTVHAANDEIAWDLAAGAFRESTHKATDNISMWLDILLTNPQEIIAAIDSLQNNLKELAHLIEEGNEAKLLTVLEAASLEWNRFFS